MDKEQDKQIPFWKRDYVPPRLDNVVVGKKVKVVKRQTRYKQS